MRRIDCHRRQQRIDLGIVELQRMHPRLITQLAPPQDADLLRLHRRQQLPVPAFDTVPSRSDGLSPSTHPAAPAESVHPRPAAARDCNHLQSFAETRDSDLHKLIQVARRDRQKLHTFQQRIRFSPAPPQAPAD